MIRLDILSDLNFDLSSSLKSQNMMSLDPYGFLLLINSDIWPNSAPLRDIRLRNLSDLDCDLSWSLKVKCDGAIRLPIYGFLIKV